MDPVWANGGRCVDRMLQKIRMFENHSWMFWLFSLLLIFPIFPIFTENQENGPRHIQSEVQQSPVQLGVNKSNVLTRVHSGGTWRCDIVPHGPAFGISRFSWTYGQEIFGFPDNFRLGHFGTNFESISPLVSAIWGPTILAPPPTQFLSPKYDPKLDIPTAGFHGWFSEFWRLRPL